MGYWEQVGQNVIDSLKYMLFGMVGIFIITAIIIGGMVLLNKATTAPAKKQNDEE